jgi:hypothetical protein
MSSWGLVLALSGYAYSGPDMTLAFAPKIYPDDFRTFWSTGTAWGGYTQKTEKAKGQKAEVAVAQGELSLKEFSFDRPDSLSAKKLGAFKAEAAGKPVKAAAALEGNSIKVKFAPPLVLKAGEKLVLEAEFK